jgi:hypothetical protein
MTFFGVDVRNGVPVGLGSIAAFGRRGFTPASLFAQGQPGVWYDPSDLGTMFTTSDGTTPVTAVEQAVGLILDKSRGLALGSELLANGTFDSNVTGWTAAADATITWSAGEAIVTNTLVSGTGGRGATATCTTVVGRTYQITARMRRVSGVGNIQVQNVDTGLTSANVTSATAQDVALYFTATGTNSTIYLRVTDAGTVGAYDFVSVREIAGTHAIQASAASRPVLRNRYNLLTYSEQFNDAAWTKNNCTITANAAVAPDGTTTADRMVEDLATSQHFIQQAYTYVAAPHTFSLYIAKSSTRNSLVFMFTASGYAGVSVDVAAGTGSVFSGSIAGTTVSVVDAGAYWLASVTATMPAAVGSANIYLINGTANSYTGDGTSSITIWGADVRRTIDTIYPYQRIEAATVYDSDTSKFPLYLAFDGSDDSLYTAANLDLSGTDKVSVFAGVTKLSDAALGIVAELSANTGANAGGFGTGILGTGDNYYALSRGSVAPPATASVSAASPDTAAITAAFDIAGDSITIRRNGVNGTPQTSDQGTGNFGSYPLYIGRRNNASSPFNGRIYQLIVRGAASSAAEISSTERYVAGKQGRAL